MRTLTAILISALACFGQSFFFSANHASGPPAPTGPIAQYDFIQGADATVLYDISGNGRNGTLGAATHAPTWNSTGLNFATAVAYQTVSLPSMGTLTQATFVIALQMQENTPGRIDGFLNCNTDEDFMLYPFEDGNNYVPTLRGNRIGFANANSHTTWHVFTVTSKAGEYKIYYDTSQVYSDSGNFAGPSSISVGMPTAIYPTKGDIAYMLVYNRALTGTEVSAAYAFLQAGLAGRGITLP